MSILYGFNSLKSNADNYGDPDGAQTPADYYVEATGSVPAYLKVAVVEFGNAFTYKTSSPNPNYEPSYSSFASIAMYFDSNGVYITKHNSDNSFVPDPNQNWNNNHTLGDNGQTTYYFKVFNDGTNDNYIALQYEEVQYDYNDDNNSNITGGSSTYRFSFLSDPVCLTDTCDVLTPNGYVNIKDLSIGDKVTTPEGENVKITKVMKPQEYYVMGKAYPHFIPKNSLGENKPSKDTFISKNHAYKSGNEWLCGQFNIEHNATNWDKEYVTYYNVMTEDYPKHTLVVNGVEMESWGGYEHNKPETHKNVKLRREKIGFK